MLSPWLWVMPIGDVSHEVILLYIMKALQGPSIENKCLFTARDDSNGPVAQLCLSRESDSEVRQSRAGTRQNRKTRWTSS